MAEETHRIVEEEREVKLAGYIFTICFEIAIDTAEDGTKEVSLNWADVLDIGKAVPLVRLVPPRIFDFTPDSPRVDVERFCDKCGGHLGINHYSQRQHLCKACAIDLVSRRENDTHQD